MSPLAPHAFLGMPSIFHFPSFLEQEYFVLFPKHIFPLMILQQSPVFYDVFDDFADFFSEFALLMIF